MIGPTSERATLEQWRGTGKATGKKVVFLLDEGSVGAGFNDELLRLQAAGNAVHLISRRPIGALLLERNNQFVLWGDHGLTRAVDGRVVIAPVVDDPEMQSHFRVAQDRLVKIVESTAKEQTKVKKKTGKKKSKTQEPGLKIVRKTTDLVNGEVAIVENTATRNDEEVVVSFSVRVSDELPPDSRDDVYRACKNVAAPDLRVVEIDGTYEFLPADWDTSKIVEIVNKQKKFGAFIVITGTNADLPLMKAIRALAKPSIRFVVENPNVAGYELFNEAQRIIKPHEVGSTIKEIADVLAPIAQEHGDGPDRANIDDIAKDFPSNLDQGTNLFSRVELELARPLPRPA